MEKENRFNLTPVTSSLAVQNSGGIGGGGTTTPLASGSAGLASMSGISNIAAGVALAARKLATEPSVYQSSIDDDMQHAVATLQLSPIKELDSGSVNNTLHAGSPTTVELARAILPNSLHAGTFGTRTLEIIELFLLIIILHFTVMPNSPSLRRITAFPTTTATSGNSSPAAHEVSVAIATVPVIQNRPTSYSVAPTLTHQSHNVIISEVSEEADEVDFKPLKVKLSRQNSTVSEHIGGSASTSSTTSSSQRPPDTSTSAPSTLTKAKTEAKTGEVYV